MHHTIEIALRILRHVTRREEQKGKDQGLTVQTLLQHRLPRIEIANKVNDMAEMF
jgi:hypothetical protein